MKVISSVAAVALGFGCQNIAVNAAAEESQPELHNENVYIEYHKPKNHKFEPIYRKLKERKLLEEFDAFLSPLQLKAALILSLEQGDPRNCNNPNSYFDGKDTLHLCYIYFDHLERDVAKEYPREPNEPFTSTSLGLMPGFTRAEVIIGGAVDVMMHELGHALFYIQGIPVLGREEDAADQVAAFIMTQFGPSVARTTIKGAYNAYHNDNAERLRKQNGVIRPWQEADEHSIDIQRAYNYLCMAFGRYPEAFQDLADSLLPRARSSNCGNEYRQAEFAFKKTLLPDIDRELMKKVQAMQIFRPEDFKF